MVLNIVMNLVVLILLINVVQNNAVPVDLLGESELLPKKSDLSKYQYSTFSDDKENNEVTSKEEEIEFRTHKTAQMGGHARTFSEMIEFVTDGAEGAMDLFKDIKDTIMSTLSPEIEVTTVSDIMMLTNGSSNYTEKAATLENPIIDPIFENNSTNNSTANRPPRQEGDGEDDDVEDSNEDEGRANEEDEEEEEEDGNMITSLISAFLGGLSRPDGSVDVEAITGLLGSLSTQNDDGTYDFNGLTDLLRSFFGGGGEDGGGSDFGAFLGGIAGAFIKGVANPPGAKGAGIFTGNLLTGILPALSGPPPPEEGEEPKPGQPTLDSGGFLGGLFQSILGSLGGGSIGNLSGSSSGSNSGGVDGGNNNSGGGGSKFQIFKAIFSLITSVFSKSSSSSPKS